MLYFKSDYTEGAHPKILEALERTNLVSQPGYGEDCFSAARRGCDLPHIPAVQCIKLLYQGVFRPLSFRLEARSYLGCPGA